jgi:hypothetical protein
MNRRVIERRLGEVHSKLMRAREELALIEEQLASFVEDADEARIRSLVSETPLADREWHEASRHAEVMQRSRQSARDRVAELERAQDELLDKLVV